MDALAAHPDVARRAPNRANLQRNKTERHRLQGLMRNVSSGDDDRAGGSGSGTSSGAGKILGKPKDEKLMDRWHTWLINGGRSKILFGVYVFLHLIVFSLGFLHYQLKDSFSNVRGLVGFGYRESFALDFNTIYGALT